MLLVYKAELLFAELFHSLFSLDDELNVAKSVIIYFYIMSIFTDVILIAVSPGAPSKDGKTFVSMIDFLGLLKLKQYKQELLM